MSRIRETKSSAALIVSVIALVAALGGGAVAGVAVTSLSKGDKKQVKKLARKLDKKIKLKPGPKGDRGPAGPRGEEATKLFAYIREGSVEPVVEYGSGVTDVSQPNAPGSESYLVTFDRSLMGCVLTATPGSGNPRGSPVSITAGGISPRVSMSSGEDNQAAVSLEKENGVAVNNSFMVAAFC